MSLIRIQAWQSAHTQWLLSKCVYYQFHLLWPLLKKSAKKFLHVLIKPWYKFKNFNGKDFEFNFENVKKNLIYIDTIYNPIETKTLKFLKENSIKTFNGLNMFIYQGQKSFYLWTKVNPEIDDELIDLLRSKL